MKQRQNKVHKYIIHTYTHPLTHTHKHTHKHTPSLNIIIKPHVRTPHTHTHTHTHPHCLDIIIKPHVHTHTPRTQNCLEIISNHAHTHAHTNTHIMQCLTHTHTQRIKKGTTTNEMNRFMIANLMEPHHTLCAYLISGTTAVYYFPLGLLGTEGKQLKWLTRFPTRQGGGKDAPPMWAHPTILPHTHTHTHTHTYKQTHTHQNPAILF